MYERICTVSCKKTPTPIKIFKATYWQQFFVCFSLTGRVDGVMNTTGRVGESRPCFLCALSRVGLSALKNGARSKARAGVRSKKMFASVNASAGVDAHALFCAHSCHLSAKRLTTTSDFIIYTFYGKSRTIQVRIKVNNSDLL